MGEWQMVAAAILGYVGQWLKAFQKFPTGLVQAVLVVVAVGLFALDTPFKNDLTWYKSAIMWALSVLGVSSLAAGAKLAPSTDSIPK